jgi:acyl dehydratase
MTENAEKLQYDESVVGVEVEVGKVEITKDMIAAYCEAVGETNPLYLDEVAAKAGPHGTIIAPPCFFTVFRLNQGLDPKVVFGNRSFAAGQHCEFLAPIRAGDTITAKTKVHQVYEKTGRSGRMAFMVRRTTYTNQESTDLAVVDAVMVYRNVE